MADWERLLERWQQGRLGRRDLVKAAGALGLSVPALARTLRSLAAAGATTLGEPTYPRFSGRATITFWSWVPGIEKVVQMFQEAYPTIRVEYSNVGSGQTLYTKLLTALRAGSGAPDVTQVEFQFLPQFIEIGGLLDLAPLGANSYRNFFVPWTWANVSRGQSVYAIPQDTGPLALIYRKDLFAQHGIPVPKTWDEFAEAGRRFRRINPRVYIHNFSPTDPGWWVGLVWAAGARPFRREGDTWVISVDDPAAVKVTEYWGELIKEDVVTPLGSWSNEWWQRFNTGELVTWVGAAWSPLLLKNGAADTAGRWAVTRLPQWDPTRFVSGNWGGSTSAVTVQTRHPEAAFLFSLWINTNLRAIEQNWIGGGLWPAALAGLQLPALHEPDPFYGGQDIGAVFEEASKAVDPAFEFSPWNTFFFDSLTAEFDKAIQGRQSWRQALQNVQRSLLEEARLQGYRVRSGTATT